MEQNNETLQNLTRAIGEIDWQIEYVLHNARLLIVRFFDGKRVILDALSLQLGGNQGKPSINTPARSMRPVADCEKGD